MTHRWRTLPDATPRQTVPVLWCLTTLTVTVIGTAAVGLSINVPHAAREREFWITAVICMVVPIPAASTWGRVFRRFAFGSAWIAVTLTAAALICGCFAAFVAVSAPGDSIGHGLVLIFGTPLLFLAILVASVIVYGVYWKRRSRRVAQESATALTDRSHP